MEENEERTLYENLEYLNETKGIIKQAIIDKGVAVSADTPFREYADKIGDITTSENLDAVLNAQEYKLAELEALVDMKTMGDIESFIYIQNNEPSRKDGIWIKSGEYEIEHIIADENVFESESWNTTKMASLKAIPYSFYNGALVVIGTDIYLLGSEPNNQNAYKYDTLTDTYTKLTNIPYSFYNGAAVVVDTDIYIFGGSGNNQNAYKYDTLTDTYTKLTNIPYNFYYGSAAVVGIDIYLFGGDGNNQSAYKYDTLTDTYTKLTNIPYNFSQGAVVAINTDIYLFRSGVSSVATYKYNVLTNTYTKLTDIPYYFYSGSAVAVGANIYLLGSGSNISSGINTVYKYNTITNTYTQLVNIPFTFVYGSAVTVGDDMEIYLFGGGYGSSTKVQIMEMNSANYDNNSFVISQGVAKYITKIMNNRNNIKFWFNNAWFYTTQDGLIKNLPTYYGNGTQWVKFKN